MDITATFLGLCKAKRALDASVSKALQKSRPQLSSTPLPKPALTEFQKNALATVAAITRARDEILLHKKDYLDPNSRLSDSKRTELETEVTLKLESCGDTIKKLKNDVHHNRTNVKLHRTEVLRILESYLSNVSRLLTDQRAILVKRALDHAKMSKLENFGPKPPKKPVVKAELNLPTPSVPRRQNISGGGQNGIAMEDQLSSLPPPTAKPADTFSTDELVMFQNENVNLYEELSGMEDEVRVIENQMTEISRLQQVFTENVLIQEHQIENVAAAAVSATENIKSGNIDIREAIQKTASFRAWILFVVLVLSFTLLFLDWYND